MPVTRRAVLKALIATSTGIVAGTGGYGFFYGRHDLEVTRAGIPIRGLPPALNGLRIGLITDVHRSQLVSHEDVSKAVGALMAERPDLIVLGGDYVTWGDRDYVIPSAEALAPLAKNGVQVLRDARTRLSIRHETIDLVGIRFWTRRQIDIAALVRDSAPMTILLAHDPRRLTEAGALSVPLVLSGHTHGGQVVLPLVGAVAARKFPVVAGIGRRDKTTMFVSRGVGTIYVPVRVNCPPEVAVLTLSSEVGAGETDRRQ